MKTFNVCVGSTRQGTSTMRKISLYQKACMLFFVFISAYCLECAAAGPQSFNTQKSVLSEVDQKNLTETTKLLTTVDRFKQIFLNDYNKALMMFTSDRAIDKFRDFNKHVWVETPPRIGWSLFMSAAVHAVGGAKDQRFLVAFYYPWADVFLITAWKMDQAIPKIIDAEMLMGDWIRKKSPELSPIPLWLRTKAFKPMALGKSVAESIYAFEQVFQTAHAISWRKHLAVLENKQVLNEVNYPVAALMLLENIKNIEDFRNAGIENNPLMFTCRKKTVETVRMAAHGHVDKILAQADNTLQETRHVLASLPPKWFRTLEASAVVTGPDGCMVFLSPVFQPRASISLLFSGQSEELMLNRIDVIDYQGFYKNFRLSQENAGSGRER